MTEWFFFGLIGLFFMRIANPLHFKKQTIVDGAITVVAGMFLGYITFVMGIIYFILTKLLK